MTCYYSVLRYLPDPVTEEAMNIGVVVVEHGKAHMRFIEDWQRAWMFGARDVTELVALVRGWDKDPSPGAFGADTWNRDVLTNLSRSWHNSVQWSPPRVSEQEPAELLADVARTYLHLSMEAHQLMEERRPQQKRSLEAR